MSSTECPRRAPLAATEEDGDLVLHDARTGSKHRLNPVASYIWEQCDGTRDAQTLAALVAARFGTSPAAVRSDVDDTLVQFGNVGLILTSGDTADQGDVLTRAVGAALGHGSGLSADRLQRVDWNALTQLAIDHGSLPMLYVCVRDHWANQVPAIVRERLRRQYEINTSVSRQLLQELLELLELFRAHDIPALPLKGPVMAMWLYGSASSRQFGDLDVFVPPDRAVRARDLLADRGYEFRARRRTDALAVRAMPLADISVDLQWALARRVFQFPVTLDELWSRTITVDVEGTPVRQSPPDDLLLILCAHASKHCWSSLIWIADIVAFLQTAGRDTEWSRLLKRAADVGGERQLLLGLHLAHDVLGADLPLMVRNRLRTEPIVEDLAAEIRSRLFVSGRRSFQGSFGIVRGGLLYVRTRERLRDRVPYVAEFVRQFLQNVVYLATPNRNDRAVIELPRALTFLYYPIRLGRLAVKLTVWMTARRHGSR